MGAVAVTSALDVSFENKTVACVQFNIGTEQEPDYKTQVLTDEDEAAKVEKEAKFSFKGVEYPAAVAHQTFRVPKANTWAGVDVVTPDKDEQLALYNQSLSVKAGNAIRKLLQNKDDDGNLTWNFSEDVYDLSETLKTPTNRRLTTEEKLIKQASDLDPTQIAAFIAKLQALQAK